jgi:tRNA A22 N-methylase
LNLIPKGDAIADIGFDHGDFLVLAAARGHRVIGIERQSMCLSRFDTRHSELKTTHREYITLRCGDGPAALQEQDNIRTVTIAGLGERTIADWSQHMPSSVERIVVCPSGMRGSLRPDMRHAGFRIIDEYLAFDRDRFYPVIAWKRGKEPRPLDYRYRVGPVLYEQYPELLFLWLEKRLSRLSKSIERLKNSDTPSDVASLEFLNWVDSVQQAHQSLQKRLSQ